MHEDMVLTVVSMCFIICWKQGGSDAAELVRYLFQDPRTFLQAVRSIALQLRASPRITFLVKGTFFFLLKALPFSKQGLLTFIHQLFDVGVRFQVPLPLFEMYPKSLPGRKRPIRSAQASVVPYHNSVAFLCLILPSSLQLLFLRDDPHCANLRFSECFLENLSSSSLPKPVLGTDSKTGIVR